MTNSSTAQYALTMSVRILFHVFVSLQKSTGVFEPRVQKTGNEYAKKYSYDIISSSISEKLTRALYKDFSYDVLKPYVTKEKFS